MSVYHCTLSVALDAGPVIAGHVIANSPTEAKAWFEDYFFGYKTEGLPASTVEHIQQAQALALETWYKVTARKSNVQPHEAINY
jgi:hypothetical protein